MLTLVPLVLTLVAQDPAPPAKLEAQFAQTMTNAKLVGFFTEDGAEDPNGQRENTYQLGEVKKLESGKWVFPVVIEYDGRNIPMPGLPLDVEWAGDTPVITMTDKQFPLVGTFTARVMIYADRFMGYWDGGGEHKGLMWGRIVHDEAAAPARDTSGADDKQDDGDGKQTIHWPGFHGSGTFGVARGETRTEWDVEQGEGVAWKTKIPGLAHSSPAIWGDRIYLTSAVREGEEAELKVGLYGDVESVEDEASHDMTVHCLDKKTGELLWTKTAWSGVPAIKRHPKGSHAASTPATNGEKVLAFFGTEGLYCYDKDGELVWKKDFGLLDAGWLKNRDDQWGYGSSPVIHGNRVLVQCDIQDESFVACLDLDTGDELWRTMREEVPTWATPTVDVREGRSQVICNGWQHIGGYDLETGAELWKLVGGGDIPIPKPIVAHDLIFITNGHGRMKPIYAIDAMAEGEIDAEHEAMAWMKKRRGNYFQTPVVLGDHLYLCAMNGVLSCYDAKTGEEVYRERLGDGNSGFTSCLIAAGDKLYATSEVGEVYVVRAGKEFEVLAVNTMGEECMATPAVSAGSMFWRSRGHLIAIEPISGS